MLRKNTGCWAHWSPAYWEPAVTDNPVAWTGFSSHWVHRGWFLSRRCQVDTKVLFNPKHTMAGQSRSAKEGRSDPDFSGMWAPAAVPSLWWCSHSVPRELLHARNKLSAGISLKIRCMNNSPLLLYLNCCPKCFIQISTCKCNVWVLSFSFKIRLQIQMEGLRSKLQEVRYK